MCGLAGYFSSSIQTNPSQLLHEMGLAIITRGPDDGGVWFDNDAGIGLSHRRLSIVDLSAAGHQPMQAASGRYIMAFNGEIYNHVAIRRELEDAGHAQAWRGHSDTETLLAGFDAWGVEKTIVKSIGMFAIALWDKQDRTLTLIRDRLGEKPVYYGWQGDSFLFGSELKALKRHPAFSAVINRGAIALLMQHNYIPAPHSIYQDIQKLLPGSMLTLSLENRTLIPKRYWDARQVVASGIGNPYKGSIEDSVSELEVILKDAVKQQMMADVPLGAFLSGGIDSSTIVALMQAQSSRPVRTFTIGFNEADYNEAEHAKAVAKHLGTDHTELYVSAQQALNVIPNLPSLYCEPFADSSQIPTFLVSQMARQHVTVSLSGDAGDELFSGYSRYMFAQRTWQRLNYLPIGLRVALAKLITILPTQSWNRIIRSLQFMVPDELARVNIGDKLHKGAGIMAAQSSAEFYRLLGSHWSEPYDLVLGATELDTVLTDSSLQPQTNGFIHEMMALDMLSYLPDDILTKVDRAAMGVSLETRVPLLDHRVVEFAWRLPIDYKYHKGIGKWPLREVLYKYVPKELIERPKMGFGIPVENWLRGPLRDWAEALLDESRLRQEGYFNPLPIRQKWAEHLSGKRNWHYRLWNVLMFQAWLEHQKQ